jgi:hypothetical protein
MFKLKRMTYMMATINQPLTNLQLELLKLYSLNLPEESLIEIKRLIAIDTLIEAFLFSKQQWN